MKADTFCYCSQAVHLALMVTLQSLEQDKTIPALGSELIKRLTFTGSAEDVINGKYDGQEVFGKFNSGGNGVSTIWRKLDLGQCVGSFEEAKPGDMGKIFWNDLVGKGEHGHVVVFQEINAKGDICIWSCSEKSETPGYEFKGGYGVKCYPREKAHRVTLCTLERPENIKNWLNFPSPL